MAASSTQFVMVVMGCSHNVRVAHHNPSQIECTLVNYLSDTILIIFNHLYNLFALLSLEDRKKLQL